VRQYIRIAIVGNQTNPDAKELLISTWVRPDTLRCAPEYGTVPSTGTISGFFCADVRGTLMGKRLAQYYL
jgi:hypothetical protein